MKIAFVIPQLHSGGAERQLYNIIKRWVDNDKLFLFYFYDGDWTEKFLRLNKVRIIRIKSDFNNIYISSIKKAFILGHYIKSYRINYLYTWLFEANFIGLIIKLLFLQNIIFISSIRFGHNHYFLNKSIKNLIEYFFYNLILYFSNKVIINSFAGFKMIKNEFILSRNNLFVVPNGVEPQNEAVRHKKNITKKIVLGYLGRLNDMKNPLFIIKALSKLPDKKNYIILYAGREDGIKGNDLIDYAYKYDISIEYIGNIDNINDFFSNIDILVSPSSALEGTSNSILEAISYGLPVIASDIGDSKLILKNIFGLIFTKENIEEFHIAINNYMKNDLFKKSDYFKICKEYIEKYYSYSVLIKKTREILEI